MIHDLYIFGSAARGEVSPTSDIDVLVVPLGDEKSEYPAAWSVYSPAIIQSYFESGRLFAWHLHLEAKCIHSARQTPFLSSLGTPAQYSTAGEDINDLESMLGESLREIQNRTTSLIYELGIAYTAIRDIAMAASWVLLDKPCFSRDAPFLLPLPCPISRKVYRGAMLARHSSTRGSDNNIDTENIAKDLLAAPIQSWIREIRSFV
ncbi:nucleotidyltransferase-like protein [Nitrosomonas oligotropha]|uniref:Nucleotidyltransferase-like protein n=1 Tax=Nitrosomonas oligotropha TaxID=42354 RepID=A0A2T5GZ64_9PROT|nr:nucleotidyltransferase-like protein [Nitrosomonas oligotropha]